MFDGLTMVSYDGHNRNKMMVDHVWTMVDHGRPWSGGQMFAGVMVKLFQSQNPTGKWLCQCEAFSSIIIRRHFYGIDPL